MDSGIPPRANHVNIAGMRVMLLAGLLLHGLVAAAECVPVSAWVAPPDRRLQAETVLQAASAKTVVLLGEEHDRAEHHRWQLHTLAALHARRPQLVLGFEMFPRRVQGALDRWVAGELSEAQFLAAAEWRRVWNMDAALYLPLFHFARMHRIPMVALDVERSERAAAAPTPAPPSEGYVAMLKEIYGKHPQSQFQRFVESQTRHDRVMAQSIADALAARPGAQIVGILGRGHAVHGYGVPHQLRDLGVRDVGVLLPWDQAEDCSALVAGYADAVFGVANQPDVEKPRLGVSLEGLKVISIAKGSIAEQSGLRAGDVLVEIAGRPSADAADVSDAVERQAPGTWLPLKVRRGGEVLELIAKFPPLAAAAPLHYELDVRIDPMARTLEGRGNVSGKKLEWRRTLEQAAFLPGDSDWYPRVEGVLASYDVTLELPEPYVGVVPGNLVSEERANGKYRARFSFPAPGEAIDLMIGPYAVEERLHRSASGKSVRLRTYFHREIAALSAGYLDAVAGYLDLYEKRIGAYPFDSFSAVSSPTPTGYGMPSLTYLGIEVLKLPFIRATSLGHEVLHNWWGNGVYVDYAKGNWAEGLTTFMADYAYREREGDAAAREMRLAWLRDIAAVPPGKDEPLAAFRARTHATSQITGYRKAGMVFVMLRDTIGAAAFEAALRDFWRTQRFRVAAWSDLQRAFESASGQNLEPFFSQWLDRRGAPRVEIAAATATSVTLVQDAPSYALRIPVQLNGETTQVLDLSQARQTFTLDTKAHEIALDPDVRVLRRLLPGEAPPILRAMMVAPNPALEVLTASLQPGGKALAAQLFDHPLQGGEPTLVIGEHRDVDKWLAARGMKRPLPADKGSAQAWMQPEAKAPLAIVSVRDAEAFAALSRPLPHYGAQSFVVFEGSKAMERGVWPSRPQVVKVQR
jgi:aminopeptidase N